MTKIFLVGVQDWETKDRKTGEIITGKSYVGYLKSGNPIKFTSNEEYNVFIGEVEYDDARAVEIPLITKFFGGKVTYQDGRSYGKE